GTRIAGGLAEPARLREAVSPTIRNSRRASCPAPRRPLPSSPLSPPASRPPLPASRLSPLASRLHPRRRRFGRVDELVVLVHRQLRSRVFVHYDVGITMQLQRARRHHTRDGSLHRLRNRPRFGFSARHQ